jgi:hypothetical protein
MGWMDRVLGAVFLGALSAPGFMALHHGGQNAERAAAIIRRRPTPGPTLPHGIAGLREFPERFDSWFSDAWGGREPSLRTNARLSMELFGTSPASHLFFGEDGWVFTKRSSSMESFTGTDPLGDDELAAWQRSLEDRKQWLASRGIDHLVVLVPHKSTIYPEKLPEAIRRERGTSRREQFLRWMEAHSDVSVLDIAPGLLDAKPNGSVGDTSLHDLYSPLGVHWTALGAHAAYVQIAEYLAEHHGSPAPLPLDEFTVELDPGMGDSWAGRMLLDGVIEMKNLRLEPRRASGVTQQRSPVGSERDFQYRSPRESAPRIVMAHDSFGPKIRGLLAPHASLLETRWRGWLEKEVVERVKPDIVIELYSELLLRTQRPFRRPEYLSPQVPVDFAEARTLLNLDLSAPLEFEEGNAEHSVTALKGSAVIRLHRGVTRLRIPPPKVPPAPGSELFLLLDVESTNDGQFGLYSADKLVGQPAISEFIPLPVGPKTEPIYVPLVWEAETESTWLFLPASLGELTLHRVELRAR